MKTNANKGLLITFIVLALNIFGIPQAFPAEAALVRGGQSATALKTPQQVEHFMQLDEATPFSHAGMFLAAGLYGENIVKLKLRDALDLGLKNNLISRTAEEKVAEALGRKLQSMSPLLPHLEAGAVHRRTFNENLEAQGFGKAFGKTIGPFNTFDARLQLTQEVINLSALANFQAGLKGVNVARYEKEFAKQQVGLLVSLDYLSALRAQGDFKAAEANLKLSQKLFNQAQDQFKAGVANSVDVARAQTRLAEDEFRLAQTRTSVHEAYLDLQRSAGLPYDRVVTLVNTLGFINESIPPLNNALQVANDQRLDLRVSRERIAALQDMVSGAKRQSLPTVELLGNYGVSGNEINKNTSRANSVMLQASVPLFEGGAIHGKVQEVNSQKRQAEIYYDDLRRQVAEDVQKALWLLDTTMAQVNAASHVVGLAQRELALASDRFTGGVGDNIEVIGAQTALSEARSQYIAALMLYHTARVNFYFAIGKTDAFYLRDIEG